MEEIGQRNESVAQHISESYTRIKEGDLAGAMDLLEKALALDFDNEEVVSGLKCATFWKERSGKISGISDLFEQGEYLLEQWKVFQRFVNKIGQKSEQCLHAFRQWVFSETLAIYSKLNDKSGGMEPEILVRIGRCYKAIGDYEHALEFFEKANQERKDDPEILSELGDCYALINEIRISKAFFREAFFLNPQKIDLASMESEMLKRLVEKLSVHGYSNEELKEWIPVYAVLYGVFNVKRELRPIEFGKLKQSIYALEHELRDKRESAAYLVPRLLNRYFWLIDHYVSTKEDRGKIDEVMMKIRELDASIYNQYTN